MKILKEKILPVLTGFVVASLVMLAFEYVNSQLYPFPSGMDIYDYGQIANFVSTLPLTAFILVVIGWSLGAFLGAFATTRLSKEKTFFLSMILGIVLTIAGIANNFMISSPVFMNIYGLFCFIIFSYIGFHSAKKLF